MGAWRNTRERYGLVSIVLHWATALTIIALFAVGLWMVDLTYYDPWYNRAPDLHKATGVLLLLVILFRLLWRQGNPRPAPLSSISPLEKRLASLVHGLLYALVLGVICSGYLISTADGRAIDVFGLFQVPATIKDLPQQADIAGEVHFYLAVTVVVLASLHGLAALKHHFVDKDATLVRMLRVRKS